MAFIVDAQNRFPETYTMMYTCLGAKIMQKICDTLQRRAFCTSVWGFEERFGVTSDLIDLRSLHPSRVVKVVSNATSRSVAPARISL